MIQSLFIALLGSGANAQAGRGCPYVGLAPFSEADSAVFFGRETDIEDIAAHVADRPLTLLYGPSGVGKTSVLRAGVVPYLRRTLPDDVIVVFSTWQDPAPLRVLKSAMTRELSATGQAFAAEEQLPLDDFIIRAERATRRRLLFIFDQFEEFFVYHPTPAGDIGFDEEFARTVNRRVGANFLVALREDSLAKMDRFQGRISNLMSSRLHLKHLDYEGGRAAIIKPLEIPSPGYTQRVTIEPELVDALIEQVNSGVPRSHSGRDRTKLVELRGGDRSTEMEIEAPFLQMVLTRLWDEEMLLGSSVLRLQTLQALGGAQHIVATHLDAVMAVFDRSEQEIARRVMHFLVTPTGTRIVQAGEDLVAYADLPAGEVLPVLERLVHERLLRAVAPGPDQSTGVRYEVFHDVLARLWLDWRRRYDQEYEQTKAARRKRREQALPGWLRLTLVVNFFLLLAVIFLAIALFRK